MAVDKGRPMPGAAVLGGGLKCAQAGLGIGAVDLGKMKVGEVGHQLEMFPPGVFTSTGTLMA